jgi:hypothetical protein
MDKRPFSEWKEYNDGKPSNAQGDESEDAEDDIYGAVLRYRWDHPQSKEDNPNWEPPEEKL